MLEPHEGFAGIDQQELASHHQVDEEPCATLESQPETLAPPVDSFETVSAHERTEGLGGKFANDSGKTTKRDVDNARADNAVMHGPADGLYLREFRHWSCLCCA
ncbi:MAG: hypothetical protein R2848_08495 [Thermomicrobiales bacterium]